MHLVMKIGFFKTLNGFGAKLVILFTSLLHTCLILFFIEEESARVDAHMSEKSADPDKFWRFFECAMNDLVYKDE